MFNECSYGGFGDALNPGGEPVWAQLGFPSKAAWKQAGSPTSGAIFTPPPGLPTLPPGSAGNLPVGSGGQIVIDGSGITSTGGAPSGGGGGIGDLLGGIPTTYLLIGAAIVLLMVLKK